MLGRNVGALEGRGDQRMDGSDVDDSTIAALTHSRQHRACEVRHTCQHDGDQEPPLVARKFLESRHVLQSGVVDEDVDRTGLDRKSTRLNSSHRCISYAVFCLKKKKTNAAIRESA